MEKEEKIDPKVREIRIEVDTNFFYETPDCPCIDEETVQSLCLVPDQKIIAFMPPEDEWPGTVEYRRDFPEAWRWFIKLEV